MTTSFDPYPFMELLRRLDRDELLDLFDAAILRLSEDDLHDLFATLRPSERIQLPDTPQRLLQDLRAFADASLQDHYHLYKRPRPRRNGPRPLDNDDWIVACRHLMERCIQTPDPEAASHGFQTLFDLLFRLGDGDDLILHFDEDGGPWIVALPWSRLAPACFPTFAARLDPHAYAAEIHKIIDRFLLDSQAPLLLKAALQAAPTPEHRDAITALKQHPR